MPVLRCPACDIRLEEGGTHCPRCGLRVAALPRRPRRIDAAASGGAAGTPRHLLPRLLPPLTATTREAILHGVVAGLALDVLAGTIGVAARIVAASSARAVAANVLVVTAIALLVAALVLPGVRLRRWAPPQELRARVAASTHGNPRQAALLAAAAACAAGFLLAAALP